MHILKNTTTDCIYEHAFNFDVPYITPQSFFGVMPMFLILCECVQLVENTFSITLFGILLCLCCVTRVANKKETSLTYNNLILTQLLSVSLTLRGVCCTTKVFLANKQFDTA